MIPSVVQICLSHDDRPDEVAEKFTEALRQLGIEVRDTTGPDHFTLSYELIPPRRSEPR